MVTDPPYGVDYDAELAQSRARRERLADVRPAVGKVENDDRARLARSVGAVPGRRGLCLACARCTPARSTRACSRRRLRSPLPDHLGEATACDRARRLSLAARAVLVRRAQRQARRIGLAIASKPRSGRSTSRANPRPATRTQKPVECMKRPIENNSLAGRGGLRAVQRLGHHDHRRRDDRAARATPSSCRRPMSTSRSLRWQNFTGAAAVQEKTDRTFAEVAASRKGGGEAIAAE